MKASLNNLGCLTITCENDLERYALQHWSNHFGSITGREGFSSLLIDYALPCNPYLPTSHSTHHEFDSSLTCNYCGITAERTTPNEACPKR